MKKFLIYMVDGSVLEEDVYAGIDEDDFNNLAMDIFERGWRCKDGDAFVYYPAHSILKIKNGATKKVERKGTKHV